MLDLYISIRLLRTLHICNIYQLPMTLNQHEFRSKKKEEFYAKKRLKMQTIGIIRTHTQCSIHRLLSILLLFMLFFLLPSFHPGKHFHIGTHSQIDNSMLYIKRAKKKIKNDALSSKNVPFFLFLSIFCIVFSVLFGVIFLV